MGGGGCDDGGAVKGIELVKYQAKLFLSLSPSSFASKPWTGMERVGWDGDGDGMGWDESEWMDIDSHSER